MAGELPGDWTPGRITKVARMAATSRYKPSDIGYEDALDIAAEVVAEQLAGGETTVAVMLRAANIALSAEARARRKLAGRLAHDAGRYNPRYAAYWHGSRGRATSFADDLVDRLAVVQVYRALPARFREVILREAQGVDTHLHYRSEVQRARQYARRLWFDHETDPGHYRRRRTS